MHRADKARTTNRHRWRMVVVLSVASLVVLLDQVTTSWAELALSKGPIHVIGPLSFKLEYNTGAAFSLGQGLAPWLAFLAIGVSAALLLIGRRAASYTMAAAIGLILGGALGNLADRVFRAHSGAVVDFISVGFWPTFNLADASIVVGGILLVFSMRSLAGSSLHQGEHSE
ncbi:MAG: signal peptidase II [Actinobacteria bacterium]|nr:signal peptidase II [Actinomycetota bacterium]